MRLWLGVACWLPIAILSWVLPYTSPTFLTSFAVYNGCTLYCMLMFFFATVIQIFLGAPFYKGAFKSIKAKAANMDVLVVLGTSAAWLYGVGLIFVGHQQNYEIKDDNSH